MTPLDVFSCALDGINLIEASAGTGKTWNICALYLRLLLERRLEVQSILVVTFTNAATAELRSRIRARIVETLAYLDQAHCSGDDPFVPALVEAVSRNAGSLARGDEPHCSKRALQTFDEAAIFTIHGFCQRALAETPFAAGLPFGIELVEDDAELRREAVADFWRRNVSAAPLSPAARRLARTERGTRPRVGRNCWPGCRPSRCRRCIWPDDLG
ncbi:MAG: UvrD-helicase domain-containing protein [Comamonadaceae bacterium]|nr:UvrD-helicase domain-containing protein [Comamonadaceae bacterium]